MIKHVVDLFCPHRCVHCSKILTKKTILCKDCSSDLPINRTTMGTENPTFYKLEELTTITSCYSFLRFYKGNVTQSLLHYLKYKRRPDIGLWLAEQIWEQQKATLILLKIAVVIPVPIHPKRKKERGYNQSESIAKGIATKLGAVLNLNVLERVKNSTTQTNKSRSERLNRLKNNFRLNKDEPLRDKNIILIDDVITTGATLTECISVLKESQPKHIYVLTAAVA